jgi:hypothetical protein
MGLERIRARGMVHTMSNTRSIVAKIRKYLRTVEAGKKAYQRAETLLDEIVAGMKVGQEMAIGGGRKVVLKDLYAEKNRVYRAHGITRYEVALIEE